MIKALSILVCCGTLLLLIVPFSNAQESTNYFDPKTGINLEITSLNSVYKGVEVYLKATKDGQKLAFGFDGTVEIERFIVINPPMYFEDPKGTTEWIYTDDFGKTTTRHLTLDPVQALNNTLVEAVQKTSKDDTNIVLGKIGKTTTIVFPDPNPETTSVDGWAMKDGSANLTWANIRIAAGSGSLDTDATKNLIFWDESGTNSQYQQMTRAFLLFDTSSITDTDTIDSATLGFVSSAKTDCTAGCSISLVASNPAINTVIGNSDYNALGITKFASDMAMTAIDTNNVAYNNFTLNASGLANINVSGISKFAIASNKDINNTAPGNWSGGQSQRLTINFASQAGTDKDPKLTVTHSAETAGGGSTATTSTTTIEEVTSFGYATFLFLLSFVIAIWTLNK